MYLCVPGTYCQSGFAACRRTDPSVPCKYQEPTYHTYRTISWVERVIRFRPFLNDSSNNLKSIPLSPPHSSPRISKRLSSLTNQASLTAYASLSDQSDRTTDWPLLLTSSSQRLDGSCRSDVVCRARRATYRRFRAGIDSTRIHLDHRGCGRACGGEGSDEPSGSSSNGRNERKGDYGW